MLFGRRGMNAIDPIASIDEMGFVVPIMSTMIWPYG